MNVLILDSTGWGVDFGLRCNAAGHHARLCIARDEENNRPNPVGDGLIEKVQNEEWQRSMNWADLIVHTDNNKWLRELDVYRKKGYPILAASYESAQLELARGKGQALLKKCGCKVIPYEVFTNYLRAEEYVISKGERMVSKPDGDKATKDMSYVSQSVRDMIYMLRRWREKYGNEVGRKFILQEFVSGVEFAVNGWLGPKGFASFVEENFEHKKLMNDDKGPNCGEMGTVMKYTQDSALAKEVLLPLEGDLIKMGHTGSVDVSVIIDENGDPRPLEFTCRLGWPAFHIAQALHPDPCEWMADLIDGVDSFQPSMDVAVGVVLATNVAAVSGSNDKIKRKDLSGIPIYDLDNDNPYRAGISPVEVQSGTMPDDVDGQIEERRGMVSAGGYLVVATGAAPTVRQAKAEAYKAAASVEIPNSVLMRTDIGDRCRSDIPRLQSFGFASDWEY